MRLADLRHELEGCGLDNSGTKAQLLSRLAEYLDSGSAARERLTPSVAQQPSQAGSTQSSSSELSLRDIIREEVRAALLVPPASQPTHLSASSPAGVAATIPLDTADCLPPSGASFSVTPPGRGRSPHARSSVSPPGIDDGAMVLIHQGLASSSQATYASVWQSYERFAALRRFSPYPVSEHALINFLNWKFVMGSAGNSLKLYTQALRHKHVLRGLDLTPFASGRVKLLYQGAYRSPPKSLRVRDAATPEDLCSVLRYLQVSTPIQRDCAMLWSALTLAFHGLLRVSEYTATETKHSLDYRHVIVHRSSIEVHLAHTKTAQYGTGQDISVRLTGTATCPHAALVTYLKARGKQPGALFTFNDVLL